MQMQIHIEHTNTQFIQSDWINWTNYYFGLITSTHYPIRLLPRLMSIWLHMALYSSISSNRQKWPECKQRGIYKCGKFRELWSI